MNRAYKKQSVLIIMNEHETNRINNSSDVQKYWCKLLNLVSMLRVVSSGPLFLIYLL